MEQLRNERTGETGDPRENPPNNGIVRYDSHTRISACDPAGDWTRFALVEGEQANRSVTAAPIMFQNCRVVVRLLDSHIGEPGSVSGGESRRTMPLVGRFPLTLHSSAAPYLPRFTLIDLKSSMLRVANISPFHSTPPNSRHKLCEMLRTNETANISLSQQEARDALPRCPCAGSLSLQDVPWKTPMITQSFSTPAKIPEELIRLHNQINAAVACVGLRKKLRSTTPVTSLDIARVMPSPQRLVRKPTTNFTAPSLKQNIGKARRQGTCYLLAEGEQSRGGLIGSGEEEGVVAPLSFLPPWEATPPNARRTSGQLGNHRSYPPVPAQPPKSLPLTQPRAPSICGRTSRITNTFTEKAGSAMGYGGMVQSTRGKSNFRCDIRRTTLGSTKVCVCWQVGFCEGSACVHLVGNKRPSGEVCLRGCLCLGLNGFVWQRYVRHYPAVYWGRGRFTLLDSENRCRIRGSKYEAPQLSLNFGICDIVKTEANTYFVRPVLPCTQRSCFHWSVCPLPEKFPLFGFTSFVDGSQERNPVRWVTPSLKRGVDPVGPPRPRSRSEGAVRATLTRTPSAPSLLFARHLCGGVLSRADARRKCSERIVCGVVVPSGGGSGLGLRGHGYVSRGRAAVCSSRAGADETARRTLLGPYPSLGLPRRPSTTTPSLIVNPCARANEPSPRSHIYLIARLVRPTYAPHPLTQPLTRGRQTGGSSAGLSPWWSPLPSKVPKRITVLPMRVIAVSMEQCRNERAEETGDPRENPPTNDIVRHDSYMRKSGDLAED
ncbi:hypothetical protein PR048_001469 [Dryococelus australis]|uniref:Uncharacterized protein n=1 Tax=Dryococelus australis TaxID=614101 RepID=A0ABQ9IHJ9_9NEOP|nr:hypothetical protein PR048_001469 [Dryococelus australis]